MIEKFDRKSKNNENFLWKCFSQWKPQRMRTRRVSHLPCCEGHLRRPSRLQSTIIIPTSIASAKIAAPNTTVLSGLILYFNFFCPNFISKIFLIAGILVDPPTNIWINNLRKIFPIRMEGFFVIIYYVIDVICPKFSHSKRIIN